MRARFAAVLSVGLAFACEVQDGGGKGTRKRAAAVAHDPQLGVPACQVPVSECDSGILLVGRGSKGPELAAPNTLGGTCADGEAGTFHVDESLDALRIATIDGTPLAPGKLVRIEATVWAYSSYASDHLDLYAASDATAPSWTFIATLTPTAAGRQVLTTTYTLPSGALQAIRGSFRYGGSAATCTAGGYDDHDDLVFATAAPVVDTTPPQVTLTSPVDGATVGGYETLAAEASDDVGLERVDFLVDGVVVVSLTPPVFSIAWYWGDRPLGPHVVAARAVDRAGNVSESAPASVEAVDRVAPYVTIVSPSDAMSVSGVRAVQVRATDSSGVASIELWVDGALVGAAPSSPATFSWDTTGLVEGTHVLQARATDIYGNTGAAAITAKVDNTPPLVAVTTPGDGAIIGPTLTATAAASDGSGIFAVYFFLGGVTLGVDTVPPYGGTWSTTTFAPGTYPLVAEAHDWAGNVTTSVVLVTVAPDVEPPTVTLTEPARAAPPSAALRVTAAVSDAYGVSRVELLADGVLIATRTAPPYSINWTAPASGTRTFAARAYDLAGNVSESTLVVTVDATPPVVALLSPAPGATISGTTLLSADATDDIALDRVEYWADRFLLGSASAPPWQVSFDSGNLASGSWSIVAKAFDVAGHVAVSTPAAVTISNATTAVTHFGTQSPVCAAAGPVCNSGTLLDGRGDLGPELTAPGTLYRACQDGASGSYHGSPSIDRIRVVATQDPFLKPARPAAVEVAAWISALTDRVDLWATSTPTNAPPSWTLLQTLAPGGLGRQTLSATITLPNAQGYQAVRANLRSQSTAATLCTAGSTDDHDDLMFWVSRDPVPPQAALTSPAEGAVLSGPASLACAASDDAAMAQVQFYANASFIAVSYAPPYVATWDTGSVANGSYSLTCIALDTNGNATTSAPIGVTVQNAITSSLANGGFEAGHSAWSEAPYGIVDSTTATPSRTGLWKAKLRGRGIAGTDSLWQQVAIPATATGATLRFWLMVLTAEGTSYAYDKLTVTARDPATNAVLGTLATFSNQQKSSVYVERAASLMAYRGRTVRLQFDATEDSIFQTTFLVDDASIVISP